MAASSSAITSPSIRSKPSTAASSSARALTSRARSKRSTATSSSRQGAEVAGKASNVNGRISLDGAHVGGGIETVSGDIEIGANSRVEGGLLVEKPHGWSWGKSKNPRIVIGPHAVVDGTLDFRREVDLYVSDSAHVGTINGATANKFSGDHP